MHGLDQLDSMHWDLVRLETWPRRPPTATRGARTVGSDSVSETVSLSQHALFALFIEIGFRSFVIICRVQKSFCAAFVENDICSV